MPPGRAIGERASFGVARSDGTLKGKASFAILSFHENGENGVGHLNTRSPS